jgi:uncharacterized membrane protein YgdD (TMEM256/DUF423 family)
MRCHYRLKPVRASAILESAMNWTAVAAIFLALGVGFGAFGAHLLQGRFDNYAMTIWERAVMYHFFHALGILAVPALSRLGLVSARAADWTCRLLAVGIVLFAGSLYLLAITGERLLGAVTPFGGVAFIAAWVVLAVAATRTRVSPPSAGEESTRAQNAPATDAGTDAVSHPAVSSNAR